MRTPRVFLVARCVRGLESALGTEILRTHSATIDRIGHREVGFRVTDDDIAPRLRTADDVFLPPTAGRTSARTRATCPNWPPWPVSST